MKKNKPLLYDPLIINRVKQYLEENIDKTYLDVGVMTKQLQDRYPEYTRRKTAPFRVLVQQAYRIVSQSYGMESLPTSGEDSDGSDLELMDQDSSSNNVMMGMMNNLYAKDKASNPKVGEISLKPTAAEAIDISSDESGDEEGRANGKTSSKKTEAKTFREVTINKLGNKEGISKGSSSTSTTNDSGAPAEQSTVLGLKRYEGCGGSHLAKKQKLDHAHSVTHQSYQQQQQLQQIQQHQQQHLQQQQQQQQQQQRKQQQHQHQQQKHMQRITSANFNQNSNESGHFSAQAQLRPHKYKKEIPLTKSRQTFQDIGGMEKTLKELCELLMHIRSPDIYFVLGLSPPRGILLHGPSGCGKTLLANAIAGQLNIPLITVAGTEFVSGVSGESEERIRDIFEQAACVAPCVLFIDEIDTISSNRALAQKDMERRIVSQLITSFDSLKAIDNGHGVIVVGATTRPDVIDPSLRRVGRFDHEINIGIPSRRDRRDILTIICDTVAIEQKCDFDKIAELTPGYVGADLLALISRAATIAVKRKCSEQIRTFNAKAQKNMTIVDLDDDGEENDGNDKVAAKGVEQNATTAGEEVEMEGEKEGEKDSEKASETEGEKDGKKETEKEVNKETEKECEKEGKDGEKDAELINSEKTKNDDKSESLSAKNKITGSTSNAKKSTEDAMDIDDTEKEITAAEQTLQGSQQLKANESDVANASIEIDNIPEPSLFELLNWLDHPPEDITYVAEFCISFEDIMAALKVVQPSAKREGFITVPDVTWDDIGSLQEIREELKLAVLAPVKFPDRMSRLGLTAPSGVLLCGPPGCGKTLLAKAIANEAGINFISVKGPELMNMYVGESERAVRACFQRARNSAPCVIFFDEFDSLCPKRSDSNEGGSGTRVVNQLLTEMDGVEDREGVYILAATNRPDIIDPAILRPGRLDTVLYVGLPQQQDRAEILKATTKNRTRPVLAEDVDFDKLAVQTDGYTGADLAGLVRQAAMLALKQSLNSDETNLDDMCVRNVHFTQAIQLLRPSVSVQDRKIYEKLRLKYAAPRETANEN